MGHTKTNGGALGSGSFVLAIHKSKKSEFEGCFTDRWIDFCRENNIGHKVVDCHSDDVIAQLSACSALLWHFSHAHPVDPFLAKILIPALSAAGYLTFPNLQSSWHFDDKLAQTYLLQSIGAPVVNSTIYWRKEDAILWAKTADYPVVVKLRNGASSANVWKVTSEKHARRIIARSFGRGFRKFDRWQLFRDSVAKYYDKKISFYRVLKALAAIFVRSEYEVATGKERGYFYTQEYLPNNDFDTRIVVIGGKAIGIRRYVMDGDFRASGSGKIEYSKGLIDVNCVRVAFETVAKLNSNCLAFDFLYDHEGRPVICEISYGFVQEPYDYCEGYWDSELKWHDSPVCAQAWMIQDTLTALKAS